jgi:hypothetical protein
MYRIIAVFVALSSLVLILPFAAHADPTITKNWAFFDNRASDDIFGITGLRLNLSVKALGDGVYPLSNATALPSNANFFLTFPALSPLIPIDENVVFPITGGAEFTRLPNLSLVVDPLSKVGGTYEYTVTDTNLKTDVSTSHILDKYEVIPIPTNLAFSNNSTTPVFTFTDPDPIPDVAGVNRRYQVDIFDASKTNIFQSDVLSTPGFGVPIGILEVGMLYYFRAVSLDFDPSELIGGVETERSRVENRAIEYAEFHPVPEPTTMLLLGSGLLGLAGYGRKKFFKK